MDSQKATSFRRIEVCGGIASAKTTVAVLLQRLGFTPIFENFEASPFLDAFYHDPARYTFETEVSFLLQHYHQIKKESVPDIGSACDFSMILDLAYARMGLNGTKLHAFSAVYEEVERELGYPLLLVHLKCDAETQLGRIRSRSREIEASITIEFLEKLNNAVETEVVAAQQDMEVISIDSAAIDFANDEAAKREVVGHIQRALGMVAKAPQVKKGKG
jgi:deoxyadenosine/deoxycytidine kinase